MYVFYVCLETLRPSVAPLPLLGTATSGPYDSKVHTIGRILVVRSFQNAIMECVACVYANAQPYTDTCQILKCNARRNAGTYSFGYAIKTDHTVDTLVSASNLSETLNTYS